MSQSPLSLIEFLQSIPDCRKARGVRFPQWYLLLLTVLGNLSGAVSLHGLERFGQRHAQKICEILGVEYRGGPADSTYRLLFSKLDVGDLYGRLRDWMLVHPAVVAAGGIEGLVCDGKTLRGSAIETRKADGTPFQAFVAQVTLYSAQLGIAIAQACYDTRESHEQQVLHQLLQEVELEGLLIQTDALHTTQAFFDSSSSAVRTSC
ncbi:transposase family protein [Synechococcus elongatus]|uniref:transposase family protein n=1 Tax=Synechococcus elongatus TaxID=32046 RepID=UPI000F7F2DA9|nr:transposase family protein [Synechococcus elongatus]